jgi:ketosteroid isomerase-like protein
MMRVSLRIPKLLLFLVAVLPAALALPGCGPSPKQMIRESKRLDKRFVEAFKKEDLEGVMATYWNDPKVVMLPAGAMDAKGYDAIKDAYKAFFDGTNIKDFKLKDQSYEVHGDVVIGWGLFSLTTLPSIGPEVRIEGRYTEVIAKRKGAWVYILDHASVPLAPNATAQMDEEMVKPALPPLSE